MTISQVVLTELTSSHPERRLKEMGYISASIQICFLFGPSVGGIMYRYNKSLPLICAVSCFIVNSIITVVFLPRDMHYHNATMKEKAGEQKDKLNGEKKVKETFFHHILHLIKSTAIQQYIILRCMLFFIDMGLSSRSIANYYQSKFTIQTDTIAYMSSLSSGISLITQIFLLEPIMKYIKNDELRIIFFCLIGEVVVKLIEGFSSHIHIFLLFSYIPNAIISSVFSNVLKSYSSDIIAIEDTGKSLAVIGTLSSVVSIVAPLYGAEVFVYLKEDAYKYRYLPTVPISTVSILQSHSYILLFIERMWLLCIIWYH
jgi:DHA1 family tetracycline resistance protein-like MFS transporter